MKYCIAFLLTAAAVFAIASQPCLAAPQPGSQELVAPVPFKPVALPASLPGDWQPVGRVKVGATANSVLIQTGFVMAKAPGNDYSMTFRARAPKSDSEVQIWAGIHCRDRDNRYVFALRGGAEGEVYLARYAPDGNAKFLGYAPLGFMPQPGTWYAIRAEVSGDRIQIYLGDEKLPRLNVVDKTALWHNGGIALGGGWLPTEYADLKADPLAGDALAQFNSVGDQQWTPPADDKEALRAKQRTAYKPRVIGDISAPRAEFSLDGNWLFMPDQDLKAGATPTSPELDDKAWHTISVPSLWAPGFAWLYAENGFNDLTGTSKNKGMADALIDAEQNRADRQTFDWRSTKAGWYREYVNLPSLIAGRRFALDFDAIAKVSEVWVNGVEVGSHTGMFGPLDCDITNAVKPGANLIAVHCIGQPDSALAADNKVEGVAVTVQVTSEMLRSLPHGMMGGAVAGIWQPVKLVVTNPVSVSDVYVRPSLTGATFDISIVSKAASARAVDLRYAIVPAKGGKPLYSSPKALSVSLSPSGLTNVAIVTPSLAPKLWSPSDPNLYRLIITLTSGRKVLDSYPVRFGFRTFTVQGDHFLLNGKPFWLRGADPFPNIVAPNNANLARKFIDLARAGNVTMTRSHAVPFDDAWLDAADTEGMGVSFEGTWPWLMLRGGPPSADLVKAWHDEFAALIKKDRNHPSLLIWTVNNEMKFETANQNDIAMLTQKWTILNDMMRDIRKIDPTRPVVCDSSYVRAEAMKGYNAVVKPNGFDDGDIDDAHRYYGWYNQTPFHLFDGKEFGHLSTPGRPLISQEMSTGYPSNDGHPNRFYTFQHATALAFVGNDAYENADPALFMSRQALMTKMLAEAFRRSDRSQVAGILHFAYCTWFTDVWDADKITPKVTYYALQTALQPVLVSAELFGRHLYAGDSQTRRVCIANDSLDRKALPASRLIWQVRDGAKILAQGSQLVPTVPYYANHWLNVKFAMPAKLPAPRVDAQLALKLEAGGKTLSQNQYDITLATLAWADGPSTMSTVAVYDPSGSAQKILAGRNIPAIASLDAFDPKTALIVGDPAALAKDPAASAKLIAYVKAGGRALLLNPGQSLLTLFPEQVTAFKVAQGEMVTQHIPESPIFNGLEKLDLAWFEMGQGTLPYACSGRWQIAPNRDDVAAIADQCDLHGYLQSPADFMKYSGSPLLEIHIGKGRVIASEMNLESGSRDPVAGRLLTNLINVMDDEH